MTKTQDTINGDITHKMLKRSWVAAAAAVSMLAMGACTAMMTNADSPSLEGTAWLLTSLPGRTPVPGSPATARFEGGRVHGTDGCNRYNAPVTTRGSTIEIGSSAASTQMACAPETMKLAEAFIAALTSARSFRISGGQLQLLGADGSVLSTFAAQAQSLAGTSWRATAINNGKGAVVSLVADSSVTMAIAADGNASGSAGCNSYTTTYQADGSKLRFTPAAATRKMCATPGVMEQEQAFFKALDSVATMRMEADRLEMRTAEGALALMLTRNTGT